MNGRIAINKKTYGTLMLICSCGLLAASIIFTAVAVFAKESENGCLIGALFCLLFSNLLNVIRGNTVKKWDVDKNDSQSADRNE